MSFQPAHMRFKFVSGFLLSMALLTWGRAADQAAPAANDAAVSLKLSSASGSAASAAASEPPAPKFSDAQLSRVSGWMKGMAPSCPPAALASAAQHFLEELQWRQPDMLERLLTDSVSASDFESALLRHLAVQLTAAPQAALREQLALRRVEVLLAQEGKTPAPTPQAAAALLGKLKSNFEAYYRQLLEGHLDDDDLMPLLTEAGRIGTAAAQLAPAKPEELTATDILSEFSRHNQKDQALEQLRAYTIDGQITDAMGRVQRILVFKLRPDRFRLHVVIGDSTRYILAHDGTKFWQQIPGGKTEIVTRESVKSRAYLLEFMNPLFGEMDSYTFDRIEDGTWAGQKVYQITVHRSDGSHYVACIDPDTFHEVGEVYAGGIRVRYSDFREVAGVTVAFREETSDTTGHTDVFVLTRFTPNPGLVQEFFESIPGHDLNYFVFEKLASRAAGAKAPATTGAAAPSGSTDSSASAQKN